MSTPNRTPLTPDSTPRTSPVTTLTAEGQESAAPTDVGLDEDLRRFSALSAPEQLERLLADGERINRYERKQRAADAELAESKANTKGEPQ